MNELRALFAQPYIRAIFVATACGYAAVNFVEMLFHGLLTMPLAYPAHFAFSSFHLVGVFGYTSYGTVDVAGRAVNWLDPAKAAAELVLVVVLTTLGLRAAR